MTPSPPTTGRPHGSGAGCNRGGEGMKRTSVTLDEETLRLAERIADKLKLSRSAVIRLAVAAMYKATFGDEAAAGEADKHG